jgi:hypothetical protein
MLLRILILLFTGYRIYELPVDPYPMDVDVLPAEGAPHPVPYSHHAGLTDKVILPANQ